MKIVAALASLVVLLAAAPSDPYLGTEPTGLVDGGDALYGTTLAGGPNCRLAAAPTRSCGVIFRLSDDGSDYRVLHAFDENDGGGAMAPPILGPDGVLYGMARDDAFLVTIYSIHRDGSAFTVLYRYGGNVSWSGIDDMRPGIALAADGTVIAPVVARPQAAREQFPNALARVRSSGAAILHDFGDGASIDAVAARGPTIYALVAFGGRSPDALYAVDEAGNARVVLSDASLTRMGIDGIAPAADALYVTTNGFASAILRVGSNGGSEAVRNFEPARIPGGGLRSGLNVAPDGRLLGETKADPGLNCGTLFAIEPGGRYAMLASLPEGGVVPCIPGFAGGGGASLPIAIADGTVFATSYSDFARAGGYGAAFAVANGAVRVLHEFTPPPAPAKASPAPRVYLDPTGVPRRFCLALFDGYGRPAGTPSPQPASVRNLQTNAKVALRYSRPSEHGLLYEAPPLAPGMYRLNPPPLAFTFRTSIPPEPLRAPSLVAGQQFVALPGLIEQPATDAEGREFGASPITLIARTPSALRFRAASTGETFDTPLVASVLDVRGMLPIAEDRDVDAIRKRYDGKIVYPNRTTAIAGAKATTYGPLPPLRVAGVFRPYGYVATVNVYGEPFVDAANVTAVNPLVVAFTDGSFLTAAAPWQVERMISLHPLADPHWPARVRAEIKSENVIPGMNYAMVAAALGYPSIDGTIAQLERLDTWSYDRMPPYGATVHFKNGIVVKYDPPGQLP